MRFFIVLGALVMATLTVQADSTATRTVATGNRDILVVGQCLLSTGITQSYQTGKPRPYTQADLTVTECVEYSQFQVNVSGKFWNTKEAPLQGTEHRVYRLEQVPYIFSDADVQAARSAHDRYTPVTGGASVLLQCMEQQSQLSQQQSVTRSQNHCR